MTTKAGAHERGWAKEPQGRLNQCHFAEKTAKYFRTLEEISVYSKVLFKIVQQHRARVTCLLARALRLRCSGTC